MNWAIELRGVTKGFSTALAVQNLSLRVQPGQVLGFLGENGAGKTTTIKMICGLVRPTSGTIVLNGYDVSRQRGRAMRQIGAVLEGTRNIYWRLSAWQNLLYFGGLKGCHGRSLERRAEAMLTELGLWNRRDDLVGGFSRGMQQKVAIACALVGDPQIVLLDEPTLGLDAQASRVVREWVKRLARDEGKTVVLTTHQLDLAEELSDRVAIMRRGELVADKPVGELLSMFRDEAFYKIMLDGTVDADVFGALDVSVEEGRTILSGSFADQEDLHRLLDQIRRSALTVISVARVEPDLEQVFIRLVQEEM